MSDQTNHELTATDNVPSEAIEAPEVTSTEPTSTIDAARAAYEKVFGDKSDTDRTPAAKDVAATKPADSRAPAIPADAQASIDALAGRGVEPMKPPASMSPALREKWGSIDPVLQKYIIDRDNDTTRRLNESTSERKLAGAFKEAAAPYEAMFRQYQTDAVSHAKDLFNLDYQLRTGSPQQRTRIFHELMTHFQPDFNMLAQMASGAKPQVSAPAPQPVNVEEEVKKALAARDQAAVESEILKAHQAFAADPANEFLADVGPVMLKAMEAGFVQMNGNDYGALFKDAYAFACQQNPEIRAILADRAAKAAQASQVAQPTMQAKPVASIKPSLGSGRASRAPAPKFKSTEDAARAAYEQVFGR